MKNFVAVLLFCLVLPLASLFAQDQYTLSTYRVMPKPGKDAALKKAIADHAAKYHTGNWKWRVFSVLSGPDEGCYQINEGPNSWTVIEGRKDISEDHNRDYETNILPLVDRSTSNAFMVYQQKLSTDAALGPYKKALLRHLYLKPAKSARLTATLQRMKPVWEKLGMKVAVWASMFSGEPQMVVSYRLPQGFIDLEQPMVQKMRDEYDTRSGKGSYDKYLDEVGTSVERVSEDIIELLPDLSSK